VYLYICVNSCIYVPIYTHICVYIFIYLYMYMQEHAEIVQMEKAGIANASLVRYIHIYIYICVFMYMYKCLYIRTHIYTHVYIHNFVCTHVYAGTCGDSANGKGRHCQGIAHSIYAYLYIFLCIYTYV